MGPDIAIMDQQDVDPTEAGAQQGLLDGAHRSVVAVIEDRPMREAARETRRDHVVPRRHPCRERFHASPDLGREQEAVARGGAQRGPAPRLGEPVAIVRRRIEQPDPGRVGVADRRDRVAFVEPAIEIADRRRAEADRREGQRGAGPRREVLGLHVLLQFPLHECCTKPVAPAPRRLRSRVASSSKRLPAPSTRIAIDTIAVGTCVAVEQKLRRAVFKARSNACFSEVYGVG